MRVAAWLVTLTALAATEILGEAGPAARQAEAFVRHVRGAA